MLMLGLLLVLCTSIRQTACNAHEDQFKTQASSSGLEECEMDSEGNCRPLPLWRVGRSDTPDMADSPDKLNVVVRRQACDEDDKMLMCRLTLGRKRFFHQARLRSLCERSANVHRPLCANYRRSLKVSRSSRNPSSHAKTPRATCNKRDPNCVNFEVANKRHRKPKRKISPDSCAPQNPICYFPVGKRYDGGLTSQEALCRPGDIVCALMREYNSRMRNNKKAKSNKLKTKGTLPPAFKNCDPSNPYCRNTVIEDEYDELERQLRSL